jgi:two-component system, NarL family, invasion response regulator UvrY
MKKFLLIDDHIVVRSGIKGLLTELYKPCEVHEADNDEVATALLKENTYDLIMMDIQIPQADMLSLMEYVHAKYPDARVLVFSMSSEKIYAKRFLKAGAKGFLSKNSSIEEISNAFRLVLSDRKYISPYLAECLADSSLSDEPATPFDKLSNREFEIVVLLLSGQTLADICKSLNLQASTVGTHKLRAFEKLAIGNLIELKELALSYNL